MTAADLLADLRQRGVCLWRDGDLLRVDAPAELATEELRTDLARHKAELLSQLDQEAPAIPIFETHVLIQTEAGTEVLEVQLVDPPGATRWEWRQLRGRYVAELKDYTTDPEVVRQWIETLEAADSGDEGATSPLGEMK